MIEPFKYLIQPVVIEREGGRAVAEKPAQVLTVYSAAEAVRAIEQFEQELANLNEEGTDEPDQHQQDNGRAQADTSGRAPASGLRQP